MIPAGIMVRFAHTAISKGDQSPFEDPPALRGGLVASSGDREALSCI
jgi:hypothetical protein